MSKELRLNRRCRICKEAVFSEILDLGDTPPANAFLKKSQLETEEKFFPLRLYFCRNCSLVQLRHVVSPKILFKNYVYVSSTSPVFIAHFEELATTVTAKLKLPKTSLVVDIGSNDGILLKPFKRKGLRVLGIEPAQNIASLANKAGIPTLPHFLSRRLAQLIFKKYGPADLITATNVFAHINDLDEVVASVDTMLSPQGIFIIEAPYLVDFLEKNLFDTIYHEHLSCLSVKPLIVLFRRFNMDIFDVTRVTTHGGSIRVFVGRKNVFRKTRVSDLLHLEKELKLDHLQTYRNFSRRVKQNKTRLLTLLITLKAQGKNIAGFGAPAKGNTLLNYYGISRAVLDYIVDESHFKQGLYTPGTHIPIVAPNMLSNVPPDYLLLLAWNFAESIMKKYERFASRGGKFIVPVPTPKII